LKLKYDKPLSNVAFNCNLRHYITELLARAHPLRACKRGAQDLADKFHEVWPAGGSTDLVGAHQVDPGFLQLAPRLLSALETEI